MIHPNRFLFLITFMLLSLAGSAQYDLSVSTYRTTNTANACYGDIVLSNEKGNAGPYTVDFFYESNTSSIANETYTMDQGSISVNSIITGEHHIIITDAYGCITRLNADVICDCDLNIGDPSNIVDASTCTTPDGQIFHAGANIITGGIPPFTYVWNGGTSQNSFNNHGLPEGSNTLLVTDGAGCTAQRSFTINSPDGVSPNINTRKSCSNRGTGFIKLDFYGQIGEDYEIIWDNPVNLVSTQLGNYYQSELLNISAGIYCYTITDPTQCSDKEDCIEIEILPTCGDLNIELIKDKRPCFDTADGLLEVKVTGGNPSLLQTCLGTYETEWAATNGIDGFPKTGTSTLSGLVSGSYVLEVTDACGVTKTQLFSLEEYEEILINLDPGAELDCPGEAMINLSSSGGSGSGLTYQWSNGLTSNSISNLFADTYVVTVTDDANCSNSAEIELETHPEMQISLIGQNFCYNDYQPLHEDTPINALYESGSVTLVFDQNSIGPYIIEWSDNSTETIQNAATRTRENINYESSWSVTVTDGNGCSATDQINISNSFEVGGPFREDCRVDFLCDGEKVAEIDLEITESVINCNVKEYRCDLANPATWTETLDLIPGEVDFSNCSRPMICPEDMVTVSETESGTSEMDYQIVLNDCNDGCCAEPQQRKGCKFGTIIEWDDWEMIPTSSNIVKINSDCGGFTQYKIVVNSVTKAEVCFNPDVKCKRESCPSCLDDGIIEYRSRNALDEIKVYPIPANSFIVVENLGLNKYSYEIQTLSGRILSKGTLSNESNKLNISNLVEGLYLLRLVDNNNGIELIEKIIKI